MWERLAQRFGWRGLVLQIMGIVWALIGLSAVTTPAAPVRSWVLYQYLPGWANGLGWLLTGLIAVVQGQRGPVDDDSPGWACLYVMPAVRCASLLVSWVMWVGTGFAHDWNPGVPRVGYEQGILGALIYAALVVWVTVCSRWPNPRHLIPQPPNVYGDGDDE